MKMIYRSNPDNLQLSQKYIPNFASYYFLKNENTFPLLKTT